MTNVKKRSFEDKNNIKHLLLEKLKYVDGKESLTFTNNSGFEVIDFECLKEIHALIGETLKHEKAYNEFKEWYYKTTVEENEKALEAQRRRGGL